jgi:CheY-like chemotaxis protein
MRGNYLLLTKHCWHSLADWLPSTRNQTYMRDLIFWYVDDDEDDQDFLKEALSERFPNISLKLFSKGEDMINEIPAVVNNSLPHLIILDLNMPGLSGKDLVSVIRAFPKLDHTKIAFFSTSSSPNDKRWADGCSALFLTKPFHHKELLVTSALMIDYALHK